MVSTQLEPRGITDKRVLDAMRRVPRHLFMEERIRYNAYDDGALPIGQGQTISQPYMVAIMTQLLKLSGTERVLEIGTGSGYQTAVLSELSAEVYSIERISALSEAARSRLAGLGYGNAHVITADGSKGWPDNSPYDRIIITAGAPTIPTPLMAQLSCHGGILVAPVGTRTTQQLLSITRTGDEFQEAWDTYCVFVPLIGEYGWED